MLSDKQAMQLAGILKTIVFDPNSSFGESLDLLKSVFDESVGETDSLANASPASISAGNGITDNSNVFDLGGDISSNVELSDDGANNFNITMGGDVDLVGNNIALSGDTSITGDEINLDIGTFELHMFNNVTLHSNFTNRSIFVGNGGTSTNPQNGLTIGNEFVSLFASDGVGTTEGISFDPGGNGLSISTTANDIEINPGVGSVFITNPKTTTVPSGNNDILNKAYGDSAYTEKIDELVPATATSTGVKGQVKADDTHLYVCTATNTWRRVAIAAW